MLGSIACQYADFSAAWYKDQELNLMIHRIYSGHSAEKVEFVNRKFWEWCAIAQALDERCMLRTGMHGLGFAVGQEPLTSHFAGRGCYILATDLEGHESDQNWVTTSQHAASKEVLYQPLLVNREIFDQRVTFQPADMRTLAGLSGGHDFVWSSCALEHLGTLEAGLEFVLNSSELLRPGGVAVHTTEFNVQSNDATIERGGNVIYRKRDLLSLRRRLRSRGFDLASLNFDSGNHRFDIEYDTVPYMESGKRHLKLQIEDHICTSFMLIIRKRSRWPVTLWPKSRLIRN
jgi:2-polyprenyl-3-methyl-5-hydroxy-6-metoxy-1,4-benzoquinol methylase